MSLEVVQWAAQLQRVKTLLDAMKEVVTAAGMMAGSSMQVHHVGSPLLD